VGTRFRRGALRRKKALNPDTNTLPKQQPRPSGGRGYFGLFFIDYNRFFMYIIFN
jgi:hypothetical protein